MFRIMKYLKDDVIDFSGVFPSRKSDGDLAKDLSDISEAEVK